MPTLFDSTILLLYTRQHYGSVYPRYSTNRFLDFYPSAEDSHESWTLYSNSSAESFRSVTVTHVHRWSIETQVSPVATRVLTCQLAHLAL